MTDSKKSVSQFELGNQQWAKGPISRPGQRNPPAMPSFVWKEQPSQVESEGFVLL